MDRAPRAARGRERRTLVAAVVLILAAVSLAVVGVMLCVLGVGERWRLVIAAESCLAAVGGFIQAVRVRSDRRARSVLNG
ncbi:hypothetical protein [Allobranchiibius huperziae]|uniref:Uncharacterized protein n=1 Tax=Allobranchiibius huperziae TaxID=1874116 RepID=A0A853DA19_9MICO|nr:hypothetical protein [Allobranchiibius huperziae]NYJ74082.1 hypothetical protein [Allobranchiibius huperziae]